MNLVIDIGNTLVKYAVFNEKKMVHEGISENCDFFSEGNFFLKHKGIKKAIISSVRSIPKKLLSSVKKQCPVHVLGKDTKLPFKNLYKTPETLGRDRVAGLAGAHALYPGSNVLVIDAGTCITIDFLYADGKYYGGTISPGLTMKFKALHTFTGKLPLVKLREFENNFGVSTETSILSGVVNGSIAEIQKSIDYYKSKYIDLKVLMCGGDAAYLVERLKSSIFAVPGLVLTGLNELLEYNER